MCTLCIHPHITLSQWRQLGLGTESIQNIAIDPQDEQTIYAGSGSGGAPGSVVGLFRTNDGGIAWDTLFSLRTVMVLAIDPHDRQTVYANAGLSMQKSTTGGTTWFRADSGLYAASGDERPSALVIDPVRPNTLFLGTWGMYGGSGSLYTSTDGGKSWFPQHCFIETEPRPPCGDFLLGVNTIALDPHNTQTVYVGLHGDGTICKSTDGGATWVVATQLWGGRPITLLVHPQNSQLIFCTVPDSGLAVSTDGGSTWQRRMLSVKVPEFGTALAINAVHDNQVFCASGLYTGGKVYFSNDTGHTWQSTAFPDTLACQFLVVSPSGRRVYAGTTRGIWVSDIATATPAMTVIRDQPADILQNYPNPFNGATTFTYVMPERTHVQIVLYDVLGREIARLVDRTVESGDHQFVMSFPNLASGIYVVKMRMARFAATRRIVLIR